MHAPHRPRAEHPSAVGPVDPYVDPGRRRLAAQQPRRRHVPGLREIRQGPLQLRRDLLLRGRPLRAAVSEGGHVARDAKPGVQHHHQRQPMAGGAGDAEMDRQAQRHHRQGSVAGHRMVCAGREGGLSGLSGRHRKPVRLPAGRRHRGHLHPQGLVGGAGRSGRLQGQVWHADADDLGGLRGDGSRRLEEACRLLQPSREGAITASRCSIRANTTRAVAR